MIAQTAVVAPAKNIPNWNIKFIASYVTMSLTPEEGKIGSFASPFTLFEIKLRKTRLYPEY